MIRLIYAKMLHMQYAYICINLFLEINPKIQISHTNSGDIFTGWFWNLDLSNDSKFYQLSWHDEYTQGAYEKLPKWTGGNIKQVTSMCRCEYCELVCVGNIKAVHIEQVTSMCRFILCGCFVLWYWTCTMAHFCNLHYLPNGHLMLQGHCLAKNSPPHHQPFIW